MEWLVRLDGQQLGPIPEQTLVGWAREGRLKVDDLLWQPGMAAWIPVRNVPQIASAVKKRIVAPTDSNDEALQWLVPVNRSPWALAAGYLGIFSFLGVFGPFALFTGIMALREIKRNPKMLGKGRAIFGIVMGVVGTLFFAMMLAGAMFSE